MKDNRTPKHGIEIGEHYVLDFGIHKGTKLANVPADYLVYVYENDFLKGFAKKALKEWIKENLEDIKFEAEQLKKNK